MYSIISLSQNSVRPVLCGAKTYSVSRLECVVFFFFATFRSYTLNRWNVLFALFTTTPPRTFSSYIHSFVTGASVPAINCCDLSPIPSTSLIANIDCGSCIIYWSQISIMDHEYLLWYIVFQYSIWFYRKTITSFSFPIPSLHLTSFVINRGGTSQNNKLSTVMALQAYRLNEISICINNTNILRGHYFTTGALCNKVLEKIKTK